MLGPKYAYRGADGAGNNITRKSSIWTTLSDTYNLTDTAYFFSRVPDLGRGGMPYARSVQQNHPLPPHSLPDAGLVFDTLLKRDGVSVALTLISVIQFIENEFIDSL